MSGDTQERQPWTKEEAKALVELTTASASGSLTHEEASRALLDRGFPARSRDAIKDAFRRNKLVRRYLHGDDKYEERKDEVLKATIKGGDMGPVSNVQANRPRTVDEMADLFGIDRDIYEDTKVTTNQWAKNWQTKVWWKLKVEEALGKAIHFEELLEALKANDFPARPKGYPIRSDIMNVIEVVDPHHGGRSWAPETGTDWDLSISTEEHRRAHRHLMDRLPTDAERTVVRVGDDLFSFDKLIDGAAGATQKGTIQDIDTRWPKMFTKVTEMLVELLLETADRFDTVDVVVVPGNHDYQTSFYAGKFLEARFHDDKRFFFDTRPLLRKPYRWGNVLLLMAHQQIKAKKRDLVERVKEDYRSEWGKTDYVEVHMGDEHHEFAHDERSVVFRKLRALCPNDSWHTEGGYTSQRGAHAFSFHKDEGLLTQEYYRTRKQAPYRPDKDLGPILGEQ